MTDNTLFINKKLTVQDTPPFDPLQAFVRDNHIALKGRSTGPLSDLVFSAKDVFKVKGSTYGNGHPTWLKHNQPDDFTSTAIQVLLDNGADLVGKTVCDELCYSISGENWHYGSPVNPHDVRRYTGGSSSGSCASVAGGLVDFSIGSDCLGSVRVPAAYNGLLGLRPSLGRVDNHGEAPYCASMDVLGFVAREQAIFERVAHVLLGDDEKEFQLDRLLIATDCLNAVDDNVKQDVLKTIEPLKAHFNEVIEAPIADDLDAWVKTFQIVQGYEVWQSYGGFVRQYKPNISPGPKSRLETASQISQETYEEHLAKKEEISKQVQAKLGDNTILVMPTASSIAPLKSETQEKINHFRAQSSQLLCVSPLAGIPQLTLPLAHQDNVPLGISFISPKGSDQALVKLVDTLMHP